jgi:hypothetical protein
MEHHAVEWQQRPALVHHDPIAFHQPSSSFPTADRWELDPVPGPAHDGTSRHGERQVPEQRAWRQGWPIAAALPAVPMRRGPSSGGMYDEL